MRTACDITGSKYAANSQWLVVLELVEAHGPEAITTALAHAAERAAGAKLPAFLDVLRLELAPALELPVIERPADAGAEIITPNFGGDASRRAGLLQKVAVYLEDGGDVPEDLAQEAREAGIDVAALCENRDASTTGGTL